MRIRPVNVTARLSLLRLLLPLLLLLLLLPASAGAHDIITLDFDALSPGTSFTSIEIDGFVISTPSALPIEVHPGAAACAAPATCADNGTPSLVIPDDGAIRIERTDGGAFKLRSVSTTADAPIGCDYTAWLYGDPTPTSGSVGCSALPFAIAGFSPSTDGLRFVALELSKGEGHFQLDDLVVEPIGAPANAMLLSDDRSIWAAGTSEIYDEFFNLIGCTDAVVHEHAPAPAFVDYDARLTAPYSEAEQESSVSESRFAAVGLARGDSIFCWGFGTSTYDVVFRVGSETLVDFQGELQDGTGQARATLTSGGSTVFSVWGEGNPTTFHEEAVLPPGDYRLLVIADTNGYIGGWEATYDVELDLSEIPGVPALAPLGQLVIVVAAGGIGFLRLRRPASR